MKKDRTGRKMRFLIWVAVIGLLLAGCGTDPAGAKETDGQEPTATQQMTQMPTEDPGKRPGEADGFVHSYPLGTTVSYDLNGDGTDEEITVSAQEYDDGLLKIGNVSLEYMCISPSGYFTIVNVDQSQNVLLVGISDYGFPTTI